MLRLRLGCRDLFSCPSRCHGNKKSPLECFFESGGILFSCMFAFQFASILERSSVALRGIEGATAGLWLPSVGVTLLVSILVSVMDSSSPKPLLQAQMELEARVGIEPTHKAFAEPCLTTWLPRHRSRTEGKHKGVEDARKPKFELRIPSKSEPATPQKVGFSLPVAPPCRKVDFAHGRKSSTWIGSFEDGHAGLVRPGA